MVLKSLFGAKDKPVARVPSVGETRVYAIGDIHGRVDLLQKILALITVDAAGHTDNKLVFVGDYVDRGLESRKVIDILLTALPEGFSSVFLKGNHEDAMLKFLQGDLATGMEWMSYGGRETLFSYGVMVPLTPDLPALEKIRHQFMAAVPPTHFSFLEKLKLRHDVGDYCFVHAGVRPGVPLDQQTPEDMMWIRGEFLSSSLDHGKMIVHGHSISPAPEVRPNRIGIDTGAFATSRLTCLALAGTDRRFLVT